ncbi:hypothetical protein EU546_02045 [Candidatus Thorarchaeota archaeon]|nr:MAG: hypothetical protein EU546_02045 [Candidatus Thorarchaeota archaeon]
MDERTCGLWYWRLLRVWSHTVPESITYRRQDYLISDITGIESKMETLEKLGSVLKPVVTYFGKVCLHGLPLALLMVLPFLGITFGFAGGLPEWSALFFIIPIIVAATNSYLVHYLWGERLVVPREEIVVCEYQMFMFIIFLAIHLPLPVIWTSFNLDLSAQIVVLVSYIIVDGYIGKEVGSRLRTRRYPTEFDEPIYVQATCPKCSATYYYRSASEEAASEVVCQNCARPFILPPVGPEDYKVGKSLEDPSG